MKYKELKGLSEKELNEKMDEFRKELMKERTQVATGTQLKNPGRVKVLKKDIAKINFILSSKSNESKEVKKA